MALSTDSAPCLGRQGLWGCQSGNWMVHSFLKVRVAGFASHLLRHARLTLGTGHSRGTTSPESRPLKWPVCRDFPRGQVGEGFLLHPGSGCWENSWIKTPNVLADELKLFPAGSLGPMRGTSGFRLLHAARFKRGI